MAQPPDAPILQTRIIDDKSPICIPFILSKIEEHKKRNSTTTTATTTTAVAGNHASSRRPFIIGLNGVQGVGKTTLVRALANTLQEREGLSTLVMSIDDFYLTHADQLALAAAHPDNALIQYRGEPGTHDLPLLHSFISTLLSSSSSSASSSSSSPGQEDSAFSLPIPSYNKSAYSGLGDRDPPSSFRVLSSRPQILILEGWLVGFRPLRTREELEGKYSDPSSRTLHKHTLAHLEFVNSALSGYEPVWDALDAFVHVDAENLEWVYDWRIEQERQLRLQQGETNGMTDEQVVKFVDAYYPAYELYEDGVRQGVFGGDETKKGCQLRLVVGRDRKVKETIVI